MIIKKPESVLENESYKIPYDFFIRTNLGQNTKSNQDKSTNELVDFTVPSKYRVKLK